MAEGQLTLGQAEKMLSELDIKEPSSEALRSAFKVLGKDRQEKIKQNKDLSRENEKLKEENENKDKYIKGSAAARGMLEYTVELGVQKDASECKRKQNFLEKVRNCTKEIERVAADYEAGLDSDKK